MGREREEYGETLQERKATDRHKENRRRQFVGHQKKHKGSWCINLRYMWLSSKQAAIRDSTGLLGKTCPQYYGPEVFLGLEDEMSYEDAKRLLDALKW